MHVSSISQNLRSGRWSTSALRQTWSQTASLQQLQQSRGQLWERCFDIVNISNPPRRLRKLSLHQFSIFPSAGGVGGNQPSQYRLTIYRYAIIVSFSKCRSNIDIAENFESTYHTILEKGYALWNSHFRSTLKAIQSVSCLQCGSKIKITWLFTFVKTYMQHELAY